MLKLKRKYFILTIVTALFASVVIGCGKAEQTEASAEFTESAKNEESEGQSGDSLTDKLFDKDEGSEEISLLVKQTKYYSDDSIVFWIENEYDARGNIIKWTHYDPDGSVVGCDENEYDARDKMTKRTRYDSDGSISFWYEWEYNAQGSKTKQTRYDSDGSISDWYEYEYDAQDRKSTRLNSSH